MMGEKKEFPKEEFSSFRCVLECSETRYVFSPWLDSFFFLQLLEWTWAYILALSLHYSLSAAACIRA